MWTVGIRGIALAVVVVVLSIWTAWSILADTIGFNLAASAPEEAIAWTPESPLVLNQLAQREVIKPKGDFDAAQRWAARALLASPVDQQALFLLGAVAERKGDKERAGKLVRASAARSWRNKGAHLWLFQLDAVGKDYLAALEHADAIVRAEARMFPPLFPAIASFTVEPAGARALVEFLATDPPWRARMTVSLAERLNDKSRLDEIFAGLSQSRMPPTRQETRAYLARLLKDRRYQFAYEKWRASLPAGDRQAGLLYNGDFSLPTDGLPFNWVLDSINGATVGIVPDEGNGHALRVQFSGARVDFSHVRQLLLLPAGRYRLEGEVRAERLRTARGLWWTVQCVTGPKTTLGNSALIGGDRPWTGFSHEFEVPAQDCMAQELRLELPARIASEKEIEGQIWFRRLRIDRASAGAG